MKKKNDKCECVKVAVRVRPMNKHEKEQNSTLCVEVDPSNCTVSVTSSKSIKTFPFDYVYGMDSTQREVYDQVAFPIVDSIFQGYNGTVFAYGQTGCGKTFTMMGIVDDPNLKGIVPNAFSHIFGYIKTEGESKRFLVRCSFVEIYNEEVRDLLGDNSKKLDIRENPKKGTFIKDLNYVTIKDTDDTEKCLNKGNKNRHVGHTSMNDQSSRSHSLFTVYLEIEEKGEDGNGRIKSGKLNLVDLAGSERVGKTNATGQTFDEGKKINLSLTALGNVIDALSSNRKHIPYKDSKLTRLLADSLGGNTKTVMFANVSPASYNYDETLGTLRYASRAKLIKNAPKVNEDPKDALLRKYEEEIKALKEQLANGGDIGGAIDEYGVEEEEEEEEDEDEAGIKKKEKSKKKKKIMKKKSEYGDDFVQVVDDPEKAELMAKIAALEKNLIDNKKLEDAEVKRSKTLNKEKQMKENEEMEKKMKRIQEEKAKEEELLKNDVNKLQERIKELNSEIEDLKVENTKDRADYLENVKEISKQNDLYKKIIDIIFNQKQFQKICDMSRYIEEDDKWKIQPFQIKENKLTFATVKPYQIDTFIESNISKRDLVMNGINVDPKKVIFQNYENDENAEAIQEDNNIRKTKSNKCGNEERINFRKTKDKFAIDAGNQDKIINIGLRKTSPDTNNTSNRGVNSFLMNKKEREKFQELSNYSNNSYGPVFKKGSNGKMYLNPLTNSGSNKFEVSFKATLDLNNLPNTLSNKTKYKLANIPEYD